MSSSRESGGQSERPLGGAPASRCDSRGTEHRQAGRGTSALTWLIRLTLICAIVVTPWLFGGIQASVQAWLYAGVCVALGCWLVGQLTGRLRTRLPLAVIPLFCALALGGAQLVPLSRQVNATFSPAGTQWRADLLGDELPAAMPSSQCPASTRADLALLILVVSVFALGSVFFASPRIQIWLCWAVAVNGAALAFFGLIQKLTWDGMLYWSVPCHGGPFGPFVNRNNGAGYLNLCLAAALGVVVWILGRSRTGAAGSLSTSAEADTSLIAAMPLTAFSLAGCIVAGIVCALSRGAWIALIGASLVTATVGLWVRPRGMRLRAFTLVAVIGLSLVGWVGLQESVFARLGTLLDGDKFLATGARLPHWQESLQIVPDFWITGSGLGTYRYVYGLYQKQPLEGWFYHAENQYVEALADGGAVGLILLLTMIGAVSFACWRVLRRDPDTGGFAFGVAATFALATQAIHGYFDFGLYMPANAMLLALLCGAICGRASVLHRRSAARPGTGSESVSQSRGSLREQNAGSRSGPRHWLMSRSFHSSAIVALLLAAGLWGWSETRRVADVESARIAVRFALDPAETSPQAVADGIAVLGAAVRERPDDVEGQYRLAELWVLLYRLRALDQLRDEQMAVADEGRLWEATSPFILHDRMHHFVRSDRSSELSRLRVEPVVGQHLLPALQHLALARRACPLLPEVHLMTAQLCGLTADPSSDRRHIRRTRQLAPGYPELLFRCGLLDHQAGRLDSAYESWRACLILVPDNLDAMLDRMGDEIRKPETMEKLLPDSPALLIGLARQRYNATEDADVRRLLVERAAALVDCVDLPEGERNYLRGSAFALQGDFPAAVASLQRAVQLRPQETAWRYELALSLQATGDFGGAREQAKWCARTDPRNAVYRKLLEQIILQQLDPGE